MASTRLEEPSWWNDSQVSSTEKKSFARLSIGRTDDLVSRVLLSPRSESMNFTNSAACVDTTEAMDGSNSLRFLDRFARSDASDN